jgi:plastocyanin
MGVAFAGLTIAGCGSPSKPTTASSGPAQAPATGAVVRVAYKGILINPADVTVRLGQKLKWTNEDMTPHNVISTGGASMIKSPDLKTGQTFELTPSRVGVIKYVCTFHPASMVGTITVVR